MNKLTISDVALKGKRCFIRVDFNVPLDGSGNITDDIRIKAAVETIRHAMDQGAKVILASHMGRPKGEVVSTLSLKVASERLSALLSKKVIQAKDCVGDDVKNMVDEMDEGDVLLLENLRFHKEEEKNDENFSKQLAQLADVYVNDAFGTAHRAHASTAGITQHVPVSAAGFLMKKEIEYFHKSVSSPNRPVAIILGGAKASTKIGVLGNLIGKVDKILIGGGLAFTFIKALGHEVGACRVEEDMIDAVKGYMDLAKEKGVEFLLPVDVLAADAFDESAKTETVPVEEIPAGWIAPDVGPATSKLFADALQDAKTIIWNGPLGVFEMEVFERGTMEMARTMASSNALTIVGGGDTDLAVHRAGLADKMSFISTGGGAYLELLEGKELPGITALTDA